MESSGSVPKSVLTGTDSGCITRRYIHSLDTVLSAADLSTVQSLFQANHLPTANLQFVEYNTSTLTSDTYSGIQELVFGIRFFNDLPSFWEFEYFNFNGRQYQPNGLAQENGYQGPPPGPDTSGNLSLPALRYAFIQHQAESTQYTDITVPLATTAPVSYTDSCLFASLGYMDASLIPGSTTPFGQALMKVWQVTPVGNTRPLISHPLVFVVDATGQAWGQPENDPILIW